MLMPMDVGLDRKAGNGGREQAFLYKATYQQQRAAKTVDAPRLVFLPSFRQNGDGVAILTLWITREVE